MATVENFYQLQRQHLEKDLKNAERKAIHESWFNEETVDYWRHKRMYQTIEPLALHYSDKNWISLGDGRYGLDAYRLKKIFGLNVFPTDITEGMLSKGKELGVINEYGVENAEQLTFPENSFDVVFCKESFHHFPRPVIALYEMLRVCKYAVILIEPNDFCVLNHPLSVIKISAKWLLSRLLKRNNTADHNFALFYSKPHSFENSGNYVYTLSKRELEKITYALNLKEFAWKGLNDYYIEGCEFEQTEPHNNVFKLIKRNIKKMDKRCKWMPLFFDWNLITAVIFKKNVGSDLKKKMQSFGYKFSKMTSNPYISNV